MKFQSRAALLLASASLPAAFAQTWTACNPTEKSCPCDPALGGVYEFDFTKGKASDLFPADKYFKVSYEGDGVHLPVSKKGEAPTIAATKFILGGKLDVVMKIAPGKGIVSSLVFQSDDLDEIDYEWIGSKGNEVQSNYFGKGNTKQYNRGGIHPVDASESKFHKYTIEWTKEKIVWSLDDVEIRTLTPAKSAELYGSNDFYPQTPMQIKIGSWAAGDPSNSPGTIEWADGPIDYSKGPFTMVVQSLRLEDYTKGATEYCFGDKTGSWDSIKVSTDPSKAVKSETESAAPAKTTSAPSSTSGGKQTTLATTTSVVSTTSKKATTTSTSSKVNTSTMEVAPAVTQGMPDSIGGYTPEGPQNKGVSTTSSAPSGTATSAAAQTSVPSSASSVRSVGLGSIIVAVAAFFAL